MASTGPSNTIQIRSPVDRQNKLSKPSTASLRYIIWLVLFASDSCNAKPIVAAEIAQYKRKQST